MTMMNAWRRDDGTVLFLTDTAMIGLRGRVAGLSPKVLTFANINTVVAMRGSAAHLTSLLVAMIKADFRTFSEFESGIASRLRRVKLFRFIGFDLVAGHVPKKGPPRLFILSNRKDLGVPVWQPAEIPYIFNEGEGEDFSEDAVNVGKLLDNDDGSCLRWLVSTQRNVLKRVGWSRQPVASIGGSVIATTVSASGIHQEEVGRWHDDRVGQFLDPSAAFTPARTRKPKPKREPSTIMSGITY